ncbi:hypothetical protein BC834DRAFT_212003 [Gloeopeniophorella convolvens]|nr:hypothetical protein BC834DRAFT_212003 [Gloeopeniophorella convolvens]
MGEPTGHDSGGCPGDEAIAELPFFTDTRGDPNNPSDSTLPFAYERHTTDVLGDNSADDASYGTGISRCFNCGSTEHMVSSCSTPYNAELVSLSRQMFNFFKNTRSSEPIALSAAVMYKRQRYQWVDTFEPGQIQEPLLRSALGLSDGDAGSGVPWLKNIAIWGYPRGWFSEEDPREQVLQRIDDLFVEALDIGEGDHSLIIFGDESVESLDINVLSLPKPATLEKSDGDEPCTTQDDACLQANPATVDTPEGSGSGLHRWATYPSTFFSNDLLPIYNGVRLPPVFQTSSSTYTNERHLLWERIAGQGEQQTWTSKEHPSVPSVPPPPPMSPPPLPPSPPPPLPPSPPPPLPPSMSKINPIIAESNHAEHFPESSDMELSDSDD